MRNHNAMLELIATDLVSQNVEATGDECKPNYSNKDFMNAVIIFQTALMDKMWDNMDFDGMLAKERMEMCESCWLELRNLIHTYTGLDVHKFEQFL